MTTAPVAAAGSALFGRAPVIGSIARVIDAAAAGRGGALVIAGVAGVGKTSVLAEATRLAGAAGFEVRSAVGVPVESELPFGSLHTLLAGELRDGRLGERTPALRATMASAASDTPPSAVSVASELLELWSSRGRAVPILIVVDDVQWSDVSSVAVLGHIARRTVADRVAILFGERQGEQEPDNDGLRRDHLGGVHRIQLDPLSYPDTVAALAAAGCSASDAERWAPRCGGLPLAIAEVALRIPLGVADPGAVGDLLPGAYRRQVEQLPDDVVLSALHAALCSDIAVLEVLDPDPMDGLRQAERAGLLSVGDTSDRFDQQVRFRHPLLRAAVLAATSAEAERDAHRRIAEALAIAGDDDRAALHWAFAAGGLDDKAADAIAELADRAQRRGALAEAARGFDRAAALTTRTAERAPLLTRAADAWFDSGRAEPAFSSIDEAIRVAIDPCDRADARTLRANMMRWTRSPRETVAELIDIYDEMRTLDPHRAGAALASAAGAGYLGGDVATAVDHGRRAEQLALDHGDPFLAASASATIAWNAFLLTEWTEAEDRLDVIEPVMRQLLRDQQWAGIHLAEVFATIWVCAERWDLAEPLIRDLLRTTRVMGATLSVASTSLLLSSLCWRQGRWDEAHAMAVPLLEDETLPPVTLCYIRVLVAQLSASMGSTDATWTLVEQAMPVALEADVALIVATAHASLGHLDLSLGNHDAALAHLDHVADLMDRLSFHEPEHLLWHGDHLDALLRVGRTDEAADKAERLSKLAEDGNRGWLKGIVARTRAQLTDDEADAHQLFEEAIGYHEDLGMPFEVARTLLLRGRPRDLSDARRLFLRLGARAWAEAAKDREPEPASPQPDGEMEARALDVLSPSERDVAMAVVSGRTNRELAAELHLSVKTIDHYLQRAYRKLGVKNRTELASMVTRSLAAPQRSDR